jgi:nucleoside-diphosphate-sugar epimerase
MNDNTPSVLILGANGRLGSTAAQAFDAAGWRVLAQVRREAAPELPAQATLLRAPLAETATLAAAARDVSAIVYAINPLYTRWDAEALPALQSGLDLAERLCAHFLLPGNVYNFGASMPARLDEDTPQRPSTRKGEIRVEMEALMARRAERGGFAASVLRAGDFFGAGRGTWLDQAIVKSLAAGKLVYPGPLDVPHAWAYLPDLGRAFVQLAARAPQLPFASWHFEGHTLTGAELLDAIDDAAHDLGIAPAHGLRRAGMPWGAIRAAGVLVPLWRELARMSYLWRVPHALDGRRFAAFLGTEPAKTPLPVAIRASLLALGHSRAASPLTV